MMGKKILVVCLVLLFHCISMGEIVAALDESQQEEQENEGSIDAIKDEQLEQLNLEDIQTFWDQLLKEYGPFLPESQKGSFHEFLREDTGFSLKEWIIAFFRFILHEIIANGKLMGTLILLALFSAIVKTFQHAFENEAVNKTAYSVIFIVMLVIAINSFYVAMSYVEETIAHMVHFMTALLPLMLALLASTGSLASAGLFHPLVMFLIQTSGLLVQHIVLPLLFFSALMSIVSSLNDHIKVTKLADLLQKTAVGILGFFFTIFIGVISVQGATMAVTDGMAIKTVKYFAGNFIPVIGRMFTDAADTVLGASVLLKNTIGVAGVVILFVICAFPALKVLVIGFIFHFTAAVIQPIGEGPLLDSLSTLGKTVIFMFASLALVAFMFFIAITFIVASGNISLMVR